MITQKVNIYTIIILIFTISSQSYTQSSNGLDQDTIQIWEEKISKIKQEAEEYYLTTVGVVRQLQLRDIYTKMGDLENSKKAEEEAYKQTNIILDQKSCDSNEYVNTIFLLLSDNRKNKNWDKVFSLSTSMLDLIDSKKVKKANRGGTHYPLLCELVAEVLLKRNQPEEAMLYVEKGLLWSADKYFEKPTKENIRVVDRAKLYLKLTQANIYEKGYQQPQMAKKVYEEILNTYSDLTILHEYQTWDDNGKLQELLPTIKDKIEKLK